MAYGARLESVLGESPRGFESPILRRSHEFSSGRYVSPQWVRSAIFRPEPLLRLDSISSRRRMVLSHLNGDFAGSCSSGEGKLRLRVAEELSTFKPWAPTRLARA